MYTKKSDLIDIIWPFFYSFISSTILCAATSTKNKTNHDDGKNKLNFIRRKVYYNNQEIKKFNKNYICNKCGQMFFFNQKSMILCGWWFNLNDVDFLFSTVITMTLMNYDVVLLKSFRRRIFRLFLGSLNIIEFKQFYVICFDCIINVFFYVINIMFFFFSLQVSFRILSALSVMSVICKIDDRI